MAYRPTKKFVYKWARFFIDRYKTTWVLIVAIFVAGSFGIYINQRQDFPTIPANYISVDIQYPGVSSQDIEQDAILPIEQAVREAEDVVSIQSRAVANGGRVVAEIDNFDELDQRAEEISKSIANSGLPEDVTTEVSVLDTIGPLMVLGLVSDSGEDLGTVLPYATDIATRIEASSDDILRVDVAPENKYEVRVLMNKSKLDDLGLTYDQVENSLNAFITTVPGGSVKHPDSEDTAISVTSPINILEDVGNIPVGLFTINDIGSVNRFYENESDQVHLGGYVEEDKGVVREAVYLMVYKKNQGDAINIADSVNEEIYAIEQDDSLPEDLSVATLFNSAPIIESQINSLINNGLIGLFLILGILLFFINLRTALLVALIIPLSLWATLFILPLLGYTINLLTLFAMIVALGIVVDNAIVIAEGIMYHLERGKNRVKAAVLAVKTLAAPITAATLTTVIAFIPFANVGGITGEFMKFIPYTIIVMLLVSYFFALFVTPFLGRFILREQTLEEKHNNKLPSWQERLIIPVLVQRAQRFIDRIAYHYWEAMIGILKKQSQRTLIIVISLALMAVSFGFYGVRTPFETFPLNDSAFMNVSLRFPVGTSYEGRAEAYEKVALQVADTKYFERLYIDDESILIVYTDPTERADDTTIFDIENQLKGKLEDVRIGTSGVAVETIPRRIGPRPSEFDIEVQITDQNLSTLQSASDEISMFAADQAGVDRVVNTQREQLRPIVDVSYSLSRFAPLGTTPAASSLAINQQFGTREIGPIVLRDDDVSDTLTLSYDQESSSSIDQVANVASPTVRGGNTTVESVANVTELNSLAVIDRLDGQRVATVGVVVNEDADIDAFQAEIENFLDSDKLSELGLSEGSVTYAGSVADIAGDQQRLMVVFLLAVLFVYAILIYQFNSYGQPFLILLTIPVALIGVWPGFMLVDSSLNFVSGLGVVALVGIVVNDAIVYISTFNELRKQYPGAPVEDVLALAGHSRFKPILSTSITTILGILPLTIRDPLWTGLGTALICGLLFSTFGTLVVVPVVYRVFVWTKKTTKRTWSFTLGRWTVTRADQ